MKRLGVTRVAWCLLIAAIEGCKGPEGPAGPPGSDPLVDPKITPEVIWSFPDSGSVGPYAPGYAFRPAAVRFNKVMETGSVLRATHLLAGTAIAGPDVNYSGTSDGTTFTIYPFPVANSISYNNYRWNVGETYALSVDSGARDLNGNLLQKRFHLSFTPEPAFRVTVTSPRDSAINVPLYFGMQIMFNSTIDSTIGLFITSNVGSMYQEIDPYDSVRVLIWTNQNLSRNTLYTTTVSAGAHDKYGHALNRPYSFSFRTQQ